MAIYSYKTHWTFEKIKRRCFYRCNVKGRYTALDYVVGDGASVWGRILEQNRAAFETVYTNYDVEYYIAYKEEKKYSARRYRIYKYLKKMIENCEIDDSMFFLTFTISRKYEGLKYATLKKYFVEFIGNFATNWIACEDYGSQNGRLHFHCVCVIPSSVSLYYEKVKTKRFLRLPSLYASEYGFVDLYPIKSGEERKKLNYAMSSLSYGMKAREGFEGYKPFHNRNFKYKLNGDFEL